jgi:hypothetical protein
LSLVEDATPETIPSANIPLQAFPVAPPLPLETVAAVAEPFVSQEYVYLFLVVDADGEHPNANIPMVLFPVALPN